jgi:hypothetical protein
MLPQKREALPTMDFPYQPSKHATKNNQSITHKPVWRSLFFESSATIQKISTNPAAHLLTTLWNPPRTAK